MGAGYPRSSTHVLLEARRALSSSTAGGLTGQAPGPPRLRLTGFAGNPHLLSQWPRGRSQQRGGWSASGGDFVVLLALRRAPTLGGVRGGYEPRRSRTLRYVAGTRAPPPGRERSPRLAVVAAWRTCRPLTAYHLRLSVRRVHCAPNDYSAAPCPVDRPGAGVPASAARPVGCRCSSRTTSPCSCPGVRFRAQVQLPRFTGLLPAIRPAGWAGS